MFAHARSVHMHNVRAKIAAGATQAALWVALAVGMGSLPASARTGNGPEGTASHLGSYLAGRVARGQHDTMAAADYYSSALVRDPDNEVLIEQALLMDATEARWEQALILAERLAKTQPTHRMARLVLALSAAKSGRYAQAQEHFKASGTGLIGELTSAMGRAWVFLAEGNVKAAVDVIDEAKQAEWAQSYLRYHKALINDIGGRRAEARALYERAFRGDPKSLRVAMAYAHHAASAGDPKLARTIIEEHSRRAANGLHPVARAL